MKSIILRDRKILIVESLNKYKTDNNLTLHQLEVMTSYQVSLQRIQQILKGTASFENTVALAECLPVLGCEISFRV